MTDEILSIRVIADADPAVGYVIGADWALCASKAEAAKRMRGSAMGLAVAGDAGQVVSGLDRTFIADCPDHRTLINGLALIGATEQNAVVFHELPDGQVWVAAVRDGLPLPGCDRVTTLDAAHELLGEYMSFVPNGAVIGTPVDAVRTTEAVFQGSTDNARTACTYRKPRSMAGALLWAAAVLAVLIAGAFTLQLVTGAREAAEHARAAALARLTESSRIDAAISRYNEDLRKRVEQAGADLALNVPVRQQLALWLEQITKTPLVQKGFRLESVSCAAEACKFKWRALAGASLAGPTEHSIEQRDDTSMVSVTPVVAGTPQARLAEDRIELVSRFHQMADMPGVSVDVSPQLTPIAVPLPPKPNVPVDKQDQLGRGQSMTIGQQSPVSLSAPLALVRETVDMLGNSVTLKSLETGLLTSATGGALSSQIKVSGQYVRLP